ncbi:MAG: MBL fold metallo-hydrolase [Chitinivibrionales bacterium]|nr:MBL fold metallo-hydrolase [Chitinivibrionales bacterium]MBD3396145.1 MBL fold metallo-hydrolase [Chitinivibrionales bacterium]
MAAVEIRPGIHWIGVNDRTTDLFEGLWPVSHEGVSYNAYLINDEKKVIIDLAKAFKTDEFFSQIAEIVELSQIDAVVVNHVEPDHTGVLRTLKKIAPDMSILATPKAKAMLDNFYEIGENVREVQDGETLDTGSHTLTFVHTPFVHWPETMMTYETTQRILFSCDGFGGYGALRGAIFDDQCTDHDFYQREALRYFVNIVAKFSTAVLKAMGKLSDVPVDIVAPSHGLVWRRNPSRILELYKKWSELASGPGSRAVTLVYGTMYGNTEVAMNAVAQGISAEGIEVDMFDAARTHVSYILPSLWEKGGVMIGAPTYEGALFPPVRQVIEMAAQKSIRHKKAAMFGSFGWSGGAYKSFERLVEPLKWELVDSFVFPGGPTKADLRKAEEFGAAFARRITSQD